MGAVLAFSCNYSADLVVSAFPSSGVAARPCGRYHAGKNDYLLHSEEQIRYPVKITLFGIGALKNKIGKNYLIENDRPKNTTGNGNFWKWAL